VPVGDDAALAGAILALLHDPVRCELIDWARRYDADWIATEFEGIHTNLAQL
jgi:hypothetical protein